MEKIKLRTELCKGCFLCVNACPTGALAPSDVLGVKGYNIVQVDQQKCVQCGACYRMCPDYVIEVL